MGFGWSKKPGRQHQGGGAPGPLSRPHSEADFSELDENAHMAVDNMNEDEVNSAFEKMLDDMNLSEEKKEPLRLQPFIRKKEMLAMHMKGTVQVNTFHSFLIKFNWLDELIKLFYINRNIAIDSIRLSITFLTRPTLI